MCVCRLFNNVAWAVRRPHGLTGDTRHCYRHLFRLELPQVTSKRSKAFKHRASDQMGDGRGLLVGEVLSEPSPAPPLLSRDCPVSGQGGSGGKMKDHDGWNN